MQSLPYSNDIPYTIKNSLLPNGVQRSKNLIILNQFLNENPPLSTTQSLMDTDCSSSEVKTNNSKVHFSKSNENELHNLNEPSQNISFNLTEFIADRIEKSLHEDPKNIKNNKLTKVVAKTVYPINPTSSIKCQITSPIHITPKNTIFPVFKNNVHKPHLLFAPSLKDETQKSLNLHCLERMDDANIVPHNKDCIKSTEQKMSGELLNQGASGMSTEMKQPSSTFDHVHDLIHFKKVDKPSPYNCNNSNILPVSVQQGRETNHKDSSNQTSISLTSVQNFTKLGVLSLPSKTLNMNAALTNSILPNNDDFKKLNHSKTSFVSPQSLRCSPGNIVGINAKEFQHLIFMNHKSHSKIAPHLTSNCGTTTSVPTPMGSGAHEVISFPNKSHLVKLSTITQQPNNSFASSFLDFNKVVIPPAPATMADYNHHQQTSKFMVNNSGVGGTKYANSYNYLTSPPHSILSFNNYNNIGSHNIVTCPSMSVRSTPLIMSTRASDLRLPPFSILGAPAIIKPSPLVTQETPSHNLLSYNHQCNSLMTKSSFYTLEKSNVDQGGLLKSPLPASHLPSAPALSFAPSTHPHLMHLSSPVESPRKKQPRKQNLTLNKRGPELPDIDHYARCLEIDPTSTSPAQQPAFTFDSYSGRSSQKYKKSGGSLTPPMNSAVKKYREKRKIFNNDTPKPNDSSYRKKSWKGSGNMPLAIGIEDHPTDHRYRRTKAPTHHNYDKDYYDDEVVGDINQNSPFETLLQCASVVSGDEYNSKIARKTLSFNDSESKDRPALARGKYKREKRAYAAAMLPGKKRKLEGSKKAIRVASPILDEGDQDLKADPRGDVDDNSPDPEDHEVEPRYIVDGDGVRWKVLSSDRGPSPTLPRITDNNSFYQNYKPNNASSAPLHHFLRREDVKPKDFHQHNPVSGCYAALQLFLTTSLTTPSPPSPPHTTTPNPYSSPSALSNPLTETIKDDSCLKPATWKLLSLASQLDYIIHQENQHIKYLRAYKDALFDQKLVDKLDGTSKTKLQSQYLKNYVNHRTDPDVKLYELIVASLQRSMFVKNELLESRRMLLTSLTTEYQAILMHGVQNLSQLNNGSHPNRLCSSSGPVYNLFCSIAKKVKR